MNMAAPEVEVKRWYVSVDGSCTPNPGPGGYGVVVDHDGKVTEFVGGEADTTNNRMELMGAIVALEQLPAGSNIRLSSDSQYVIEGITRRVPKWEANGWRTANGKPVKNQDLWLLLLDVSQRHEVEWRWVRGHQGDPGQERADTLAREEAERQRTGVN